MGLYQKIFDLSLERKIIRFQSILKNTYHASDPLRAWRPKKCLIVMVCRSDLQKPF